jgi:hypothetical protein
MKPLKEYCKLKPMSGEERLNYFQSYMSMINNSSAFINVFNNFIDILVALDYAENAELMAKNERLKFNVELRIYKESEQKPIATNNTSREARVIPLFPTNPPARC